MYILTGTYGNSTGATTEAEGCQECPQGWYCPEATAGLPRGNLICPRGHYCPAATGDYKQYPCPVGQFSNRQGNVREEDCVDCPAGRFCDGTLVIFLRLL